MSTPNKYKPHQGKREIERRKRQIERGIRTAHVVTPKPGLIWRARVEPVSHRREYVETPCIKVGAKLDKRTGAFLGRVVKVMGTRLERAVPKVKGKAAAKAAKRARQEARKAA